MTLTPSHESSPESSMTLATLLQELQRENARLQRLVLELLYKNQQLRSEA
ncbi:hypothetical protein [Granulicella arctica]|nr:hypothetical protein [Granulicella arctica]